MKRTVDVIFTVSRSITNGTLHAFFLVRIWTIWRVLDQVRQGLEGTILNRTCLPINGGSLDTSSPFKELVTCLKTFLIKLSLQFNVKDRDWKIKYLKFTLSGCGHRDSNNLVNACFYYILSYGISHGILSVAQVAHLWYRLRSRESS